jgi:hypothetical protein
MVPALLISDTIIKIPKLANTTALSSLSIPHPHYPSNPQQALANFTRDTPKIHKGHTRRLGKIN